MKKTSTKITKELLERLVQQMKPLAAAYEHARAAAQERHAADIREYLKHPAIPRAERLPSLGALERVSKDEQKRWDVGGDQYHFVLQARIDSILRRLLAETPKPRGAPKKKSTAQQMAIAKLYELSGGDVEAVKRALEFVKEKANRKDVTRSAERWVGLTPKKRAPGRK